MHIKTERISFSLMFVVSRGKQMHFLAAYVCIYRDRTVWKWCITQKYNWSFRGAGRWIAESESGSPFRRKSIFPTSQYSKTLTVWNCTNEPKSCLPDKWLSPEKIGPLPLKYILSLQLLFQSSPRCWVWEGLSGLTLNILWDFTVTAKFPVLEWKHENFTSVKKAFVLQGQG